MTFKVFIGEYPYVSGHGGIDNVADEIEGKERNTLLNTRPLPLSVKLTRTISAHSSLSGNSFSRISHPPYAPVK